jgi:hypothetical protein
VGRERGGREVERRKRKSCEFEMKEILITYERAFHNGRPINGD